MALNLPLDLQPDLQTVLAVIGVILVLIIYLISVRQNRMRRRAPTRKFAGRGGRDFHREAPVLGSLDRRPEREEPPLPEALLGGGAEAIHGESEGNHRWDFPDDDDFAEDDADPREEAVTEAQAEIAVAATEDFPADAAPDAVPDAEAEPGHAAASRHHRDRADDAAADDDDNDLVIPPPDDDWPARDEISRAPVFPKPPGFRDYSVDGFERLSQIDYWVKITGERDVGRETVLAIYRDGAMDFSKTHRIHGLKMPEKAWRNLEDEAEDSRFADLVLTIQLADCNGAISEREMTRFSALVSRLSEGTGREFLFMTTIENAFAQAAAIAEFAAHFDSLFVVNIRPPQGVDGFDGAAIERCAPQTGLDRDDDGYYTRFKSVGKEKVTLYSLADMSESGRFDFDNMNAFSARGLTFFTRPAVHRSPGAVFAEMVDTAKAFASRIGGVASSPDHDDLSQDDVDRIRRSIEQVAAQMEELGISPGSDEAARIF